MVDDDDDEWVMVNLYLLLNCWQLIYEREEVKMTVMSVENYDCYWWVIWLWMSMLLLLLMNHWMLDRNTVVVVDSCVGDD